MLSRVRFTGDKFSLICYKIVKTGHLKSLKVTKCHKRFIASHLQMCYTGNVKKQLEGCFFAYPGQKKGSIRPNDKGVDHAVLHCGVQPDRIRESVGEGQIGIITDRGIE